MEHDFINFEIKFEVGAGFPRALEAWEWSEQCPLYIVVLREWNMCGIDCQECEMEWHKLCDYSCSWGHQNVVISGLL